MSKIHEWFDRLLIRLGWKSAPWVPNSIWDARAVGLYIFDWERRRIYGHVMDRYRIKDGDEVRFRMESGKVGRFRLKDVEYCLDPKDMLFATIEDVGYV